MTIAEGKSRRYATIFIFNILISSGDFYARASDPYVVCKGLGSLNLAQ